MCGKPDSGVWNDKSESFAGITEATRDNEEVAWPALLRELDQKIPRTVRLARVLDFGCGGGQLSHLIGAAGGSLVVGVDPAARMIAQANQRTTQGVTFVEGTIYDLEAMEPFDGIVSSMVLQFVETVEEYCRRLSSALRPGGLFAFVVFNPPFIADHLSQKTPLFFHDDCGCLRMRLDEASAPVYDRGAGEYDRILQAAGFEKIVSFPMPYSEDQGVWSDRFLLISCTKS